MAYIRKRKKPSIEIRGINERHINGMKNLVAMVIRQAYLDIFNNEKTTAYRGSKHMIARLALRWFASNDDHPWSFRWCCDQLELNESAIRRKIRSILIERQIHLRPEIKEVALLFVEVNRG